MVTITILPKTDKDIFGEFLNANITQNIFLTVSMDKMLHEKSIAKLQIKTKYLKCILQNIDKLSDGEFINNDS